MINPLVIHQNDKTQNLVRILSILRWWECNIHSKLLSQTTPSPLWNM